MLSHGHAPTNDIAAIGEWKKLLAYVVWTSARSQIWRIVGIIV